MQPEFSSVYGIHPWHYERMTPREYAGYLDHYAAMQRGATTHGG